MNLTSDQAALLARVLAEPADDTPRLLLADAFAEAGDEARGEFVRVQVRLAELEQRAATPTPSTDRAAERRRAERNERKALKRRERELWSSLDLSDLPGHGHVRSVESWVSTSVAKFLYTRGFVSRITCDWPACRDSLDAVCREQPVERVVLTSMPPLDNLDGVPFQGWWEYSRKRWPNVAFELPPEPAADFLDFPRRTARELARTVAEARERLAAAAQRANRGDELRWVAPPWHMDDHRLLGALMVLHLCPSGEDDGVVWGGVTATIPPAPMRTMPVSRREVPVAGQAEPAHFYTGRCGYCRTTFLREVTE